MYQIDMEFIWNFFNMCNQYEFHKYRQTIDCNNYSTMIFINSLI